MSLGWFNSLSFRMNFRQHIHSQSIIIKHIIIVCRHEFSCTLRATTRSALFEFFFHLDNFSHIRPSPDYSHVLSQQRLSSPLIRAMIIHRADRFSLLQSTRVLLYHQYFCMYGAMGTWPLPGYVAGSISLDWQGLPSLTNTGTATRLGEHPLPPASTRSLAALFVLYL